MKLFSAAALISVFVSAARALVVNTPANAVACQPLLITWDPQGSAGPFFLSVHPGDNPTAAALFSWDNLSGTSFTWNVPVTAGTSLSLLLRDNTGASSQSAPFTVQPGSSTCSGSSSVGSSPAGSSLSTVPASSGSLSTTRNPSSIPTVTTTSISTKVSSPVTSPTSVRPSTGTSSSSSSTGTSGALSNAVNFGPAGFLAALIGAILA